MAEVVSDIGVLLRRATQGDREASGRLLENFRTCLRRLAQRQLKGGLSARVDQSDIVQQTFLEAHRALDQFRGTTGAELFAWLERILDNTIARAVRDHAVLQKRAIGCERPLDGLRGGPELAAADSSPSERAMRGEQLARLVCALGILPDNQRQAVQWRHLENCSLAEIAERLGRSPAAAAGLIKRGLQTLRQALGKSSGGALL